ncbi:glycosyltransferase [uncultured Microbacterium sp.]|uniref:glycosyltransferase n=1 Tax=uncultured Microbacterium sp. TaxID=191216 RepID=UPI0025F82E7D|nr:glycosyltransferase [uncultured Microbacterium sp.]
MKVGSRKILALIAIALLAGVVVAVMLSSEWALIVLGGVQIITLMLLVDTRQALSARIVSTVRNFEKRLRGGARLKSGAAGASKDSNQKSGGHVYEAEIRLIRASLVFDLEWYQIQVAGRFKSLDDAISHYLERGRRAGFSPHPLFNPSYVFPREWSKMEQDPLIAYIKDVNGRHEIPTSMFFDPAQVDDRLPVDEFGPLTAFLRERGNDAPLPYDASGNSLRPGVTLDDVRSFLLRQSTEWRDREILFAQTGSTSEPPPPSKELASVRDEFDARTDSLPLVSVILPTWNRAGQLRVAIESVSAQSYAKWELIVADDGSTDDTQLVLEAAAGRDPRIVALALTHRGVCAARNAALERARGEYVAFLDSDKQWEPEFLHSMVAFLEQRGHDAGYSIVQVSRNGREAYRTKPASRESLLTANSIDQTAIVVSRSLIEQVGGFDESLLRAVDYDLILSLSEHTELVQVPFVGVRYSEDDQDPNRISEAQSIAWNFYVRDRRRWKNAELPDTVPGLVTVVVDGVGSAAEAQLALTNIQNHLGDVPAEVLVIPSSHSWFLLQSVVLAEFAALDVRVIPLVGVNDCAPLRINHAIREARGEYIYITTAQTFFTRGSIGELVDALRASDAAAIHPIVLDKSRLIEDVGVVYAPGRRDPIRLLHGLPADWGNFASPNLNVPGATLPILMSSSTLRDIHGVNTKLAHLWVDVDLSQRAAEAEGKPVVVRTDNVVQSMGASPFAARAGEHDVRMFASLWPDAPSGSEEAIAASGASAAFDGFIAASAPKSPEAWSRAIWRPRDGSSVARVQDRPARPLQWSIKTAAPADERSLAWGDFHFANSLAEALRSLGERVSVDYGPNADRPTSNSDDVVLNLRGLKSVQLPVGATSLIWVISHPEQVTAKELEAYDLRYAASASWPRTVAEQWGLDVKPLLQCTDPERFFVDDAAVPEVQKKLLMVGNSRQQYRPAACETANAGLPVMIYGKNWEKFVDEKYIAGSYVPNEQLRRYYRSAEWALNDHWPDMRDQGFVSNRIFDVLASGGRLLTDDVEGLKGLFPADILPAGVATFTAPIDLLATVESGPAKFYDDERLRAISQHVRTEHSFAARARVMLEDVRRQRAATGM